MADIQVPAHPPGESVGRVAITVAVIFGVVTSIVIFLRLFTRIYVIRTVGLDDVLMTFAATLSWAFIIATILSVQHGLGSHFDEVMARGIPNLVAYVQIIWLSSIFYNACLGFIKASVLALYMRLGDRNLRKMSLLIMAVVGCSATANVLVCIFQCDPIPAAWDVTITEKKCININAFYLANAATNIATDLLAYTLPIPLVFRLQVPKKQKIALGIMLCLGLFACISSIIRITFIPRMLVSSDPTWTIANAMYWSVIETNIGIWAASIPSYKALAKRYLPRILGEYSSKRNYPSGTGGASIGPFQKISSPNKPVQLHNLGERRDTVTDREDLYHRSDGADAVGLGRTIKIEQDCSSNSSEEQLHVPAGRIKARTQIETTYEGGSETPSNVFVS